MADASSEVDLADEDDGAVEPTDESEQEIDMSDDDGEPGE
jgi:hypothetical protein